MFSKAGEVEKIKTEDNRADALTRNKVEIVENCSDLVN